MKKTIKKLFSVFMVLIMTFTCASIAFAEEEDYTYVCGKCGETVETIGGVDIHNMVCDGNATYCESCGEIIYGGSINYIIHVQVCAIIQRLKKITVEIKNNPGETTLNYGDTLRLTAVVLDDGEPVTELKDSNYLWTADGSAVKITSYGETCEVEAVKTGTVTVTLNILDEEGNVLEAAYEDEDGNIHHVYTDSQVIDVKAGFFQKFVSFFKDLFGMDRTIVQ